MQDRNLSDEQAKAIAATDGIIGVLLCPLYLRAGRIRGTLDDFIRNVRHLTNLVGADHVAIGSDLDGWLWPVREIRDISDYERIAESLVYSGFSSSDVELIMGESLVRMLERFDTSIGKV